MPDQDPNSEKKTVFRKEALRRLSSPEQLDERMIVVHTKGWIALLITSLLIIGAIFWAFLGSIPNTLNGKGIFLNEYGVQVIQSEISGLVKKIHVTKDDLVKPGTPLAEINDGKESWNAKAHYEGKVIEVLVEENSNIDQNIPIFVLNRKQGQDYFYTYLPVDLGQQVKEGMSAQVYPVGINRQIYGAILAKVKNVSLFAATEGYLQTRLKNKDLISYLTNNQAVIELELEPNKNSENESGFEWTSGFGPPSKIEPETICTATIILESRTPISYVFPLWEAKRLIYTIEEDDYNKGNKQ